MAIPVPAATAEGGAAVEELPATEVAYLTVWEVYVRWGDGMPPEEQVTEIQMPVGR